MSTIKLYHGTTAAALLSISQQGIRPRGKDVKRNNWTHTVGSNNQCVYLTDAYAFYFAWCAADPKENEDLALIEVEIDTRPVRHGGKLQADEDALEQTTRGKDRLPANWGMKRRTIFYRARAHLYSAADSLEALGTCGHRGTVPVSALRRVVLVEHAQCMRLIFGGFDPLICVENYAYFGAQYRQGVRWFFDDEPICEKNPALTRDGITVYNDIHAALAAYDD